MSKLEKIPGFAPSDMTDNRKLWDWDTRYPDQALKAIRFEAVYLAVSLLSTPLLLFAFYCRKPFLLWTLLNPSGQAAMEHYGLAWIGGMLGGTLFALKWLYHVVAHGLWNLDRRLWRLFTPHISAGLAFALLALVSSGLMRVFDTAALSRNSMVVGLSFLVGYFSDSAVAKLTEISNTLFGVTAIKGKQVPELAQSSDEQPKPSSKESVADQSHSSDMQ